jgi:Acetyltransferase (GNAT) domain
VGLYLVRDDHRGSGLGMRIWQAGHAHLEGMVAGLDSVDAQVASYERWGYRAEGHTHRYEGRGPQRVPEADLCPLKDGPWSDVLEVDARGFPARREEFLRRWTAQPEGRALALRSEGRVTGYGVLRRCREGYKVGPLFAPERRGAESLLDGLVSDLAANEPWWIDVPESNPAAVRLADDRALAPGFRTSRMYRGRAPDYERSIVFGVTTLELG